jgi:hypothetical protein
MKEGGGDGERARWGERPKTKDQRQKIKDRKTARPQDRKTLQ